MLLVRIWWGRVAGTDAILDITDGSWIYQEVFTASRLLESMGASSDNSDTWNVQIVRTSTYGSVLRATLSGDLLTVNRAGEACSKTVSIDDVMSLKLALRRLENSRSVRVPPCKPGREETVYTIDGENENGEMHFEQRFSCLSVDPDFARVVQMVDEIRQQILPACRYVFLPGNLRKNNQ